MMTSKETAYPGLWDNSLSPYLTQLMDKPAELDGPKMTVITKPAQVGVSEALRNLLRYWAHHDPGPCLVVYPDVGTAKTQFIERLIPLFENDGILTKFRKDDGMITVSLHSMEIYVTWASNPTKLAARPIRYLVMDEVDKMRLASTSREQGVVALAYARLRTFKHTARAVLLSTPSIREGPVTVYYEQCDENREWQIRCPSCDTLFFPNWSTVHWPKRNEDEEDRDWSSRVVLTEAAWMECPQGCRLDEIDRLRATAAGEWVITVTPEHGKPRKVGYKFNVLGTSWTPMHELAAKFITVCHDPNLLQEFINQDLGEVYEDKVSMIDSAKLAECIEEWPIRSAPDWVGVVIAGVDSQQDGFFWVVRGYGEGKRSILLDFGFAHTVVMLRAVTLDHLIPQGNGTIGVSALAIDARGSPQITELVLAWALTDPRIRPIMGVKVASAKKGVEPIREVPWQFEMKRPEGSKWLSGKRYSVDVNYFKDLLVSRMNSGMWKLPTGVSFDYLKQMESESKVKQVKRGQAEWVWKKKSTRTPNHYWDCETYCEALAWRLRLEMIPDERTLLAQRHAVYQPPPDEDKERWIEGFSS